MRFSNAIIPGEAGGDAGRGNGKLLELIEHVSVAALTPYGKHARLHPKDKIRRLRYNINEFGFLVPLLVDAAGVVIAGHARLQAAFKLGFDTVPVIRVTHLSEAQVRTYRIADNRLAEIAEWDNCVLALEFEAILESDVDLDLTGFSIPEIDLVFAGAEGDTGPEEPDEAYLASEAASAIRMLHCSSAWAGVTRRPCILLHTIPALSRSICVPRSRPMRNG